MIQQVYARITFCGSVIHRYSTFWVFQCISLYFKLQKNVHSEQYNTNKTLIDNTVQYIYHIWTYFAASTE